MSSAAEAIMGATPPPPRPAAGKVAASSGDAPSFDHHLAAETKASEEPLVSPTSTPTHETSDAPAEASAKPNDAKESDPTSPDTPSILPTAHADAPAPAIIVQLIAQTGGEPTQTPTAPTDASAPVEASGAAQPSTPNTTPPDSFEKTLAKSDVRETLPAQPAHVEADMQPATSLASGQPIDEAPPPTPPTPAPTTPQAAPPAAQQTIAAAPAVAPKPANKSAPDATSSEATEADVKISADAVDAPKAAAPAPRTSEPRNETPATHSSAAEAQAPKAGAKSEDSSAQEKLATAIENDAAQPQAKINSDRVVAAAPAPDTSGVQSAPDIALPSVGAISDARPTAPTSPLVAAEHAAATRAAPAGAQVAREIVRRFDGETTKFEMRLDPPELGRVEVRMEVTRDHKVSAVLTADSPQALIELARHARELEQTLQSAGLELQENGLSFDLRQGGDDASQARGDDALRFASGDTEIEENAPLARPIGLERWRGVRVDVMA
jgi:flagellar hook-length control protein FliK